MKKWFGKIFMIYSFLTGCAVQSYYSQNDTETSNPLKYYSNYNNKGLSTFYAKQDPYKSNIIQKDEPWGTLDIKYQVEGGNWLNFYAGETTLINDTPEEKIYRDYRKGVVLKIERTFKESKQVLDLDFKIKSAFDYPVTIGDLVINIPWTEPAGEEPQYIFEKTYIKHQHIAGDGSFIYFVRPSGEGPFLLLIAKPGTRLEYFETTGGKFKVYIHSALSSGKKQGTWRLKTTEKVLQPEGEKGDEVTYGIKLLWLEDYAAMRRALYKYNLFDMHMVPGMTIPQNLKAKFSIRTKNEIDSIVPEFPQETKIELIEKKDSDISIYEADFERLGENKLTIHYNKQYSTILEFFSTEPIETLIKKRTDFLVKHQQHRDTTKWYNGLYSIWDMRESVLRGPDNTDGFDYWWGYVLAADDIGLVKAPFIANKNVWFPDDQEIASVEYFIKNFVWGGLQRTDKELPNPYGIYGTPNWKSARDPLLRAQSRDYHLDRMKVWRSYDYPHLIKMYYHMFQIAEFFPEKVKYLDAKGYLERAFQTAKAYFMYPYEILPWYETYKWGCYNELIILPLIEDLERLGRKKDAAFLRGEWEKKVKYFVYDDEYPYRSEYSIDRTAFESSYALAKYGALNSMPPDKNLWYDKNLGKWYSHPKVEKNDSRDFMIRQHNAGIAVRGWINPSYYTLGSDDSETHSLTYMARMGGWSILDYGLNFAKNPFNWIQLGYASYLSSFALMNTGTADTNYGYWFPGKENDGALGWAYNSEKNARTWLQGREMERGPWYYDGEADLGMGAIFHTAATILVDDPIFGWFAYGGILNNSKDSLIIEAKDGVRNRFGFITKQSRFTIELNRDSFSKEKFITTDKKGSNFTFYLENQTNTAHEVELNFTGTAGISYNLFIDDKKKDTIILIGPQKLTIKITNPGKGCKLTLGRT